MNRFLAPPEKAKDPIKFFVEFEVNEEEWSYVYSIKHVFQWIEQTSIDEETNLIVVKDEIHNLNPNRVPANIMRANASRASVVTYQYMRDCFNAGRPIKIRADHLPDVPGIKKKMTNSTPPWVPFLQHHAFFFPEKGLHHGRDEVLAEEMIRLAGAEWCSSVEELRSSKRQNKLVLHAWDKNNFDDLTSIHYHWLYESLIDYELKNPQLYVYDFTVQERNYMKNVAAIELGNKETILHIRQPVDSDHPVPWTIPVKLPQISGNTYIYLPGTGIVLAEPGASHSSESEESELKSHIIKLADDIIKTRLRDRAGRKTNTSS